MQKPERPDNEAERLRTLRGLELLDSAPSERFDRVTRIARRLLGMPIALVSLVDSDRQWFRSSQGLSVDQTPRDVSFCGHAILGSEPLVVADTRRDERFRDKPLVEAEPHIRFYAGCPIAAPDGHRMGTLCVVDREPRELGEEALAALVDLAAIVEAEIEALVAGLVDPLTHLWRESGFERLGNQIVAVARRSASPIAVMTLEVERFDAVRAEFGEGAARLVVRAAGKFLRSVFRDSDVIARIRGPVSRVLLFGPRERDLASVLERLERRRLDHNASNGQAAHLSFTVGTAWRGEGADLDLKTLVEESAR